MTTDQRRLCLSLIVTPPFGKSDISKEDFTRRFASALENGKLSLHLLEQAQTSKNADDLQCALLVGHAFGFSAVQVNILCDLLGAKWHFSHEDLVDALDSLKITASMEALYDATQWVPDYLAYDQGRSLAIKAIWALGNLKTSEARLKLNRLATESNALLLREEARRQLRRND